VMGSNHVIFLYPETVNKEWRRHRFDQMNLILQVTQNTIRNSRIFFRALSQQGNAWSKCC
jgi:hypothetical protein